MKLVEAVEGGLTGTVALSVLQETLYRFDRNAPRPLLHQSAGTKKRKQKKSKKNTSKRYLNTAGELLSHSVYFGLPSLGDKNKAVLRGGLIGAAAGVWNAFDKKIKGGKKRKSRQRFYNLFLYTAAGLLAGSMIKHGPGGKKKQSNKKEEVAEPGWMPTELPQEKKVLSTVLYIDDFPVGYKIQKINGNLFFMPTQFSAKECCPPKFSVVPDSESWLFEPNTIEPNLQNQVIQELRTIEVGKLLE